MERISFSENRTFRLELLSVGGLYVFFWLAYAWALMFTTGWTSYRYIYGSGLDYLLKGILTIPVWWTVFRKMRNKRTWKKYAIHIILCPIWVFLWINSYYAICDLIGYGHLGGSGIGWDIYIPILFYVIQFGLFHLYDETKQLAQQEKRSMELRELALRNELTALKAQLNPHFLYNVFNTINASISPGDEYTRELIATLSDLFRYQLQASKQDTVSLKDEIVFIKGYLELEKARFQDRLHIDWQVDNSLLDSQVPPMIMQPIVENAIKHGISPLIEGGTIAIEIQREGEQIFVQISDDGVGFHTPSSQEGSGVGLTNTRKMLQHMYGTHLNIKSSNKEGTEVSFHIPLTEGAKVVAV